MPSNNREEYSSLPSFFERDRNLRTMGFRRLVINGEFRFLISRPQNIFNLVKFIFTHNKNTFLKFFFTIDRVWKKILLPRT